MDQYFLERHYHRLEESKLLSRPLTQPPASSPTRVSPLGKAKSEPKLGASASSSGAKPAPLPVSKNALLQGGIKEANKAAWSKTLGKEGNAITHSDAVARTTHVQVGGSRTSSFGIGMPQEQWSCLTVDSEQGTDYKGLMFAAERCDGPPTRGWRAQRGVDEVEERQTESADADRREQPVHGSGSLHFGSDR